MKLLVVGLNHQTAPVEVREKIAFSEEQLGHALKELLAQTSLEEAVILSTCNRVEIYGASAHPAQTVSEIEWFLRQYHHLPDEALQQHLYSYSQQEAIYHGFRVASGLDSMIVGENQIFSQIKEAYQIAYEQGFTGNLLNLFFHRVFNAAKRVRTETEIGAKPVNVSSAAIQLAKNLFGEFEEKNALLLGAGKMGELSLRYLEREGISKIFIANRNFEKAKELAKTPSATPIHFEEFPLTLPLADIVIACTGADHYLITLDQIRQGMELRKNKPMFLMDLSIPRNIDPEITHLYNVYLFNLDDLKEIAETGKKERELAAKKGEQLLKGEVSACLARLEQVAIGPTLQLLSKKFDQIRNSELEKLWSKLRGLTPEQRETIQAAAQAMVSKILHDPLLAIKAGQAELEEEHRSTYLKLIQKLFRLNEI